MPSRYLTSHYLQNSPGQWTWSQTSDSNASLGNDLISNVRHPLLKTKGGSNLVSNHLELHQEVSHDTSIEIYIYTVIQIGRELEFLFLYIH